MKTDVIIIGGGAAGMTAAIFAAREGRKVCVIEHRSEPGKKLLQTGNGKCNLTHEDVCAGDYLKPGLCSGRGAQAYGREDILSGFLGKAFQIFGYRETIIFFESIGIPVRNKGGYIYPYSGTALSVRNALWDEMKRLGVMIMTDTEPGISFEKGIFKALTFTKKKADGKEYTEKKEITGEKLILATGLKAAPGTGSDGSGIEIAKGLGLKINRVLPALVKLKCSDGLCKPASGVRHICRSTLYADGEEVFKETGEVQFTDDGISGIPVFNMSRFASVALDDGGSVIAILDLLPDFSSEECYDFIDKNYESMKDRKLISFFGGLLPGKLLTAAARSISLSSEKKVSETGADQMKELIGVCKGWKLEVLQAHGFEAAQVCSGGVDFSDIDPSTMEVKKFPGLYVAGELADVDGPCGGFNLQWAWTSGAIAGENC